MTRLSLSASPPSQLEADALVVGAYRTDNGPVAADSAFAEAVAAAGLAGADGSPGAVTIIPATGRIAAQRVMVVGLGPAPAPDRTDSPDDAEANPLGKAVASHSERVRRAAGAASRAAAGRTEIVSTLAAIDPTAAAEGHLLGAYVFQTYRKPKDQPVPSIVLAVPATDEQTTAAVRRAEIGAAAVAFARNLVNSAPNDLYPAEFAGRAKGAAEQAGLDVQVLDEKALAAGGFGGLLAVGGGSTRPPRLVRISYTPAQPRAKVALVGKGITFDSGGLSIKPSAKMDQMTSDMSGAAAVVATVVAAAQLELPLAVTAYAALAENLPSGSAYRPGDVIRHYGGAADSDAGKTVHVLNTDAEGRLVLADAIVRACEDNPDYLLDTATLTGAQVVSLGRRTMGVMGSPELRDRVAELARSVGEGGWAMPLPEHLREGLDSSLADLQNISSDPGGGMLVAGFYLSEFVADGVTWAHLDIAGPAFNDGKAHGYTGPGGTGVPVRTLLAVLEDLARRT